MVRHLCRMQMQKLQSPSDWERLLESSRTDPVVVFKHSPICGIGTRALEDFGAFSAGRGSIGCVVVDVVENRNLSSAIGQRMGVPDESPQIIAIKGERPIWHASHGRIELREFEEVLRAQRTAPEASQPVVPSPKASV